MSVPVKRLGPELRNAVRQFTEAKDEGARVLGDLSEAQRTWRPAPETWSVGECAAHLNITLEQYLPRIDDAMTRGRAVGLEGEEPFRYSWLWNRAIRMMEPPSRIRMKAPKKFATQLETDGVTERWVALHDEMLERIQAAAGLHLSRVKVVSPVSKLFRISLGQVFRFLAAHECRHLWQARRVLDRPGFPSS